MEYFFGDLDYFNPCDKSYHTANTPTAIHTPNIIPRPPDDVPRPPDDDDDDDDGPPPPGIPPPPEEGEGGTSTGAEKPDHGEVLGDGEIIDEDSIVTDPDRGDIPTSGKVLVFLDPAPATLEDLPGGNDFERIVLTHRIVTINSPDARPLDGTLRLEVVEGDPENFEIHYFDPESSAAQEITSFPFEEMITEPGHHGGGVHDWHSGTVSLNVRAISRPESPEEEPHLILRASADPVQGAPKKTLDVVLLPVDIVPDFNRDGVIGDADRGKVNDQNPWRWWKNDDNDDGEIPNSDTPGFGISDTFPTNKVVDGLNDLVDFFPLYLDLETILNVLSPDDYSYYLKHEDGAFNFVEMATIEPAGDPLTTGPGSFVRSLTRARFLADADLETATAAGTQLTANLLNAIKDTGKGIVLLEAAKTTQEPLIVEIRDSQGSQIAEIPFPVRISEVEEMYRHIDLRDVPVEYDDSSYQADPSPLPTSTGDPGEPYPDSLTNGKYFAFVHGYNVEGYKAQGWNAEIFKRLHQLGSTARFVGVSWHGDTGLDYHRAVFFAFQTGDELNDRLNFVDGDLTIAAHSLGNVVVSHAIEDGGLTPSNYYMINAAAPREAYSPQDVSGTERYAMTESDWKANFQAGQERSFAANWHELFEPPFASNDGRASLTWKDRFASVSVATAVYNFYSTGEDVVQDPTIDSASVAANILEQGFNFVRGAWGAQEFVKGGTSIAGLAQSRLQAGWGYRFGYSLLDPANYSDGQLRTTPFFEDFEELDLFDLTAGSALAATSFVQYDVLARGLPSMSWAAAANSVSTAGGEDDMQTAFKTNGEWPTEGHEDPADSEQWLHSDFKAVGFSYVFEMYKKMIELGELNQQ